MLPRALEDKALLIEAAPGPYFETDDYRGWPLALARMSDFASGAAAQGGDCVAVGGEEGDGEGAGLTPRFTFLSTPAAFRIA